MSSRPAGSDLEPLIWARLIEAQREIPAEVARYWLSIEFGDSDRQRLSYLADLSEAGVISPDEQAEFDSYLHVGNLLAVMQAKARAVLGAKPPHPVRN